ncbi:MAG: hypothetical protein AAF430_17570 [Myxococcota bacterium]
MWKNALWFAAGSLVGGLVVFGWGLRMETAPPARKHAALEGSLERLADAVRDAGQFVRGHLWYGSEREQAEAHRHVVRALVSALESKALTDPDFPDFAELDPRSKGGMDNPDQRYLGASLRGDAVYRVFGDRGSSRRLDFTLYGEDELSKSISTLTTDALVVDDDGGFEVFIGGAPREHNWLASRPGTVRLLVRQIHSDWSTETPGSIHIDRVDGERPTYPPFSPAIMAERLDDATTTFARNVRRWPEFSRTRLHALLPENALTPPRDTGTEGGLSGRLMVGGHYELADDEALWITTWPSDAAYQGIQLGHHWWESLDYANRQVSLTADQAHRSSDGAFHFVVSARDPGVANWLDTEGFRRGVVMLRYDGLGLDALPEDEHPVARRVPLDALWSLLPADEPRLGPEERAAAVAERRRHVQARFRH